MAKKQSLVAGSEHVEQIEITLQRYTEGVCEVYGTYHVSSVNVTDSDSPWDDKRGDTLVCPCGYKFQPADSKTISVHSLLESEMRIKEENE